ncbi:MAG: hypothetical protein JRJ49_10800 [Deltaproteobacteria bacterium]|nr:hypothetical protein [Deltaproteobacteria bacterium]
MRWILSISGSGYYACVKKPKSKIAIENEFLMLTKDKNILKYKKYGLKAVE